MTVRINTTEAFWATSADYFFGPLVKEPQVSDFSTFDPAAFLDATTDQALERRAPLPAAEYLAVIQDLVVKPWTSSKDPTKAGMKFDVKLVLDIPAEVQASLETDFPTLTVPDSVMLDLTESGAIDWGKGKNGKLRMYRDATGQNTPGQAFSPRMLTGKVVKVRIKHDLYEGNIYERPDGVAKA